MQNGIESIVLLPLRESVVIVADYRDTVLSSLLHHAHYYSLENEETCACLHALGFLTIYQKC